MRLVLKACGLLLAGLPALAEPIPIKVIPFNPANPAAAEPQAGQAAIPPVPPLPVSSGLAAEEVIDDDYDWSIGPQD